MPQKPLCSEYECGRLVRAVAFVAACPCCRTTPLIEAYCQVDSEINANGRSARIANFTRGSLLCEIGSQSPCRWLWRIGIYVPTILTYAAVIKRRKFVVVHGNFSEQKSEPHMIVTVVLSQRSKSVIIISQASSKNDRSVCGRNDSVTDKLNCLGNLRIWS